MFIKGKNYIRRELHKIYGGQHQGGISTPRNYPIILLFTGSQGEEFGYMIAGQRKVSFVIPAKASGGIWHFYVVIEQLEIT